MFYWEVMFLRPESVSVLRWKHIQMSPIHRTGPYLHKLYRDRRSVGQFISVLGPHLWLTTRHCGLRVVGRPPWREDGSVIVQFAVIHAPKSRRTHDHILLSYLRLAQHGGPESRIYIPHEQGGTVVPLGTGFPFCCLLRLAGLWGRYSNPPLHGTTRTDTVQEM
jgi:hypothetical protein